MGFLDNSGDIILDAVLTDAGRTRLARGDGSFQITTFALGDDEINYGLYNKSHPSGSAYYDLEILQTPVFEAFTNNMSSMKSMLLSITRTNLLYLPTLKLNGNQNTADAYKGTPLSSSYLFLAVDQNTIDRLSTSFTVENSFLNGVSDTLTNTIRIEQGLDTSEISYAFPIDIDLKETAYIIEIDNRFGSITIPTSLSTTAPLSYIDDDNVASYYVTSTDYIQEITPPTTTAANGYYSIQGPKGTVLNFRIKASLELNSSTFLFTQLGGTEIIQGQSCRTIASSVKVTGVTTGISITVPIKFIKKDNN
jgi:hypothetical protein